MLSLRCNDKWWSSVHNILPRSGGVKEHLDNNFISELDDGLLYCFGKKTERFKPSLKNCPNCMALPACLQRDDSTIAEVRLLSDLIIEYMTQMNCRPSQDPSTIIVECVTFGSALVNIQQNLENDMTYDEKEAVHRLLKMGAGESTPAEGDFSFAEFGFKKFKVARHSGRYMYVWNQNIEYIRIKLNNLESNLFLALVLVN